MSGTDDGPAGPIPWAPVSVIDPDGVFGVDMDGEFAIADGVCNGGYVLAVIHQVALEALTGVGATTTSAAAVSSQFLAPTAPGPATVRIARMRTGRTLSRVDVELESGGRTAVRACLSFLAPAQPSGGMWRSVDPPAMAAPEACRQMPRLRRDSLPWPSIYWTRIELLVDPATSGFMDGTPSGRGEIRTWWSTRDERVPDAGLLLLALDAMPPGTMELDRVMGGSPTVQLEARLYADRSSLAAASRPFVSRQQVLTAGEFTADQVCEVWDSSGRFLASATQVNWLL